MTNKKEPEDWFDQMFFEYTGIEWKDNPDLKINPPLKEKDNVKRKQKTPRKGV